MHMHIYALCANQVQYTELANVPWHQSVMCSPQENEPCSKEIVSVYHNIMRTALVQSSPGQSAHPWKGSSSKYRVIHPLLAAAGEAVSVSQVGKSWFQCSQGEQTRISLSVCINTFPGNVPKCNPEARTAGVVLLDPKFFCISSSWRKLKT